MAHHIVNQQRVDGVRLRFNLESNHFAKRHIRRIGMQTVGVRALHARSVAAQRGLAFDQENVIAVLARLHGSAYARKASADNQDIARDLFGYLVRPIPFFRLLVGGKRHASNRAHRQSRTSSTCTQQEIPS